jgi:hypothetical protein
MASEANIRISLGVRSGNVQYQNARTAFRADMGTPKGPTPGVVTCSTNGTDIDLSQLVEPGLCLLENLDDTNFVEVGIYDPNGGPGDEGLFVPMIELLPGELYVVRLTRNLGEAYPSGSPGTDAPTRRLRVKANTSPCDVGVYAFER